jgi:hypothetical protein
LPVKFQKSPVKIVDRGNKFRTVNDPLVYEMPPGPSRMIAPGYAPGRVTTRIPRVLVNDAGFTFEHEVDELIPVHP